MRKGIWIKAGRGRFGCSRCGEGVYCAPPFDYPKERFCPYCGSDNQREPVEIPATIGERIKQALKMRHMTEKELGTKIGRNGQTICRWVTGEIYPRADMLARAAIVLGVSMNWMFGLEDD